MTSAWHPIAGSCNCQFSSDRDDPILFLAPDRELLALDELPRYVDELYPLIYGSLFPRSPSQSRRLRKIQFPKLNPATDGKLQVEMINNSLLDVGPRSAPDVFLAFASIKSSLAAPTSSLQYWFGRSYSQAMKVCNFYPLNGYAPHLANVCLIIYSNYIELHNSINC